MHTSYTLRWYKPRKRLSLKCEIKSNKNSFQDSEKNICVSSDHLKDICNVLKGLATRGHHQRFLPIKCLTVKGSLQDIQKGD